MSVITTGAFPKELRPGVFAWTQLKYKEHEKLYPLMFEEHDSKMAYEELVAGNTFGLLPVKDEGGNIQYQSESQAYTTRATNVTYAGGYIITLEEAQDNLYEELGKRRGGRLAKAYARTKETVGANVYNRAFDSNYTFGDSKELLATDHSTLNGDQSNELAVSADLSEAALEDLCIQIRNATDNVGNRINLQPKRLIVAPANKFEACRILKSELQNDTANNATNALKTLGIIPEMADNPYLTDADAWFVRTDVDDKEGLICFNRQEMQPMMDNDSDTLNEKHIVFGRYVFTVGDWRSLYGSDGA